MQKWINTTGTSVENGWNENTIKEYRIFGWEVNQKVKYVLY